MSFTVRRAGVDDAPAAAMTHARAVAATYVDLMPPEFAVARLAEVDQNAAQLAEAIRRAERDEANQQEPYRRHWVAVDERDEVIGVASSGPGVADWERQLDYPPPAVEFQLQYIYTLAGTHGSGLGAALMHAAIDERDTHLWIVRGNARAEAFYRKHGFTDEGTEVSTGPLWFNRRMFRMHRRKDQYDTT